MEKQYAVYILASERNGTLYVGITGDLEHRVWEHKQKKVPGFTQKYDVNRLVYYELHNNPNDAILREKQIKAWKRRWKLALIEKENPKWDDFYADIQSDLLDSESSSE